MGGKSVFTMTVLTYVAYVAAVECRPVLHHCVVIFFWSSEIMDCMLFTFKNSSYARGTSVVQNLLLLLMNSFHKTDAAFFHAGYAS